MISTKPHTALVLPTLILLLLTTCGADDTEVNRIINKLSQSLTKGSSLGRDGSISSLMDRRYSVCVGGGIFNFLKWKMKVHGLEILSGYYNHHLPGTVKNGYIEGFASHKTSGTATGGS